MTDQLRCSADSLDVKPCPFCGSNGSSAGTDDPTADARWNEGCDFALEQVCKYLKVDPKNVTWDAATETIEGDMAAVINSIMDEADKVIFASPPPSGDRLTDEPQEVGIPRRSEADAFYKILQTIARFPITDPKNMDAVNMRLIAEGALVLSRPQPRPESA